MGGILRPTGAARERILSYGGAGAGKTNDWLQIAQAYAECDVPPGKFYVLDTDYTVERSLDAFPLVNEKKIVTYKACPEWEDVTRWWGTFKRLMKPDDWFVIDMISPLWEMVQEEYVERIFKKDLDEFFLKAREGMSKGNPLDGFKDWSVINKMYRGNVANEILRNPCHVYATGGTAAVSSDLDSKEIRQLFGKVGFRPTGQKGNAHLFHTVLLKTNPKKGEWQVTTVKDRSRVEMLNAPVGNFVEDYLVKVAGWEKGAGDVQMEATA